MPYIDIAKTFNAIPAGKDEALAMVVNSIAFEETNLAELIDTQSREIACLSKMFNGDVHGIGYAIDINQSINSILEKVIRLLIHQQLVLEAIYKIFSSECPSEVTQDASAVISDIGKTNMSPDMPTEPDISYVNHAEKFENIPEARDRIIKTICALKGRGVGTVRNRSDYFYEGIAIIQVFVCFKPQSGIDNYLCYSVHNSTNMQILIAFPDSLKIECRLSGDAKKVEIKGEGKIIRKERCQPDVIDKGAFELNVFFEGNTSEKCCFYMTIKSKGNASFDHWSGKIELDSGLLEMEDRLI